MTIYLVTYYGGYGGYTIDKSTRYFTNKDEAKAYADKLNAQYNIKDFCCSFVIEEITKG